MRRRYYALAAAVLTLVGTGFYLLKTERFSVALRDQLTDSPLTAGDSLAGVAAAIAKPSAPETAVTPGAMGAPDSALKPAATAPGTGTPAAADEAGDPSAYLKAPPLSEKERKSVQSLLATFFNGSRGKKALNRFLDELDADGLEPVVAKDQNPYTGKMLTVRTKEALEGTRYLHAQFFQDESANQEPFRQHISFEIRPSPDCMKVARETVEKLVGHKLGAPVSASDDRTEWSFEGNTIWIKRLARDDIPNNPFNARTMKDLGTCWVAEELMPEHHDGLAAHVN